MTSPADLNALARLMKGYTDKLEGGHLRLGDALSLAALVMENHETILSALTAAPGEPEKVIACYDSERMVCADPECVKMGRCKLRTIPPSPPEGNGK